MRPLLLVVKEKAPEPLRATPLRWVNDDLVREHDERDRLHERLRHALEERLGDERRVPPHLSSERETARG